ncbi:hypothetical protein [Acidianus bottle-shaped virus 3 strain ABV3]|uniref:Uncharacterized protein n=1 Tax=Acidianus bottle-shaped virus 3 strain ABV3 TaxID=1732174 RepID=A0A0N9NI96_9VIRU|nr:hypothetical protein AVU00_gp51 [Acidianus bottle-shaped virus 3 strain ABV3]ALG96853.1 hypothetical protein [Acidianus bottle-shaped virus 3 strain ABV3]
MKLTYILVTAVFISLIAFFILRNHPVSLIFFNLFTNVLTVLTILLKDLNIPVPAKISSFA